MRVARILLALCVLPSWAAAHPAPFSFLDLRLSDAGVEGALIVHDFDVAHDLGIEPPGRLADPAVASLHLSELTRLMDSRVRILLDGRPSRITWSGLEVLAERQSLRLPFRVADARPGSVRVEAVVFPYDPVHQTFVNVYEDGTLRHQAILDGARVHLDYFGGTWQGTSAVLAVFIPAGIEHILIGPDHVLFLIGLLLLGGTLWKLSAIVTAFTFGHSITLTLAALDLVSPPARLVEPVIALSIVFVGADNLLVHRDRMRARSAHGPAAATAAAPRDIRAWVAGVFGLVHGFGFASVLKEFGLPASALGWSLFSFNAGVEIGQLAIVLVAASAISTLHRRNDRLGRALVVTGSGIVVAAGGYWFIERVFFPGGV
ncbi:MAG: HupE/UreJ family protein [Acidobacteriota bacterium]